MTVKTIKKHLEKLGVYVEYESRDVGHGWRRGWWHKNKFIGDAEQLQNYFEELKER